MGQVGLVGDANATGARQNAFLDMLEADAAGLGPSVAANLLRDATDRTRMGIASGIGSIRGLNGASAARQLLQGQAAATQQAAGQAAQLRAQEMLAARGLLGQSLEAKRAQDLGQQGLSTGLLGTLGGLNNAQNATRSANQQGANQINAATADANANREVQKDQLDAGVANTNSEYKKAATGATFSALGSGLSMGMGGGKPPGAYDGEKVPGKAKYPGDHPGNDTVIRAVSPGEGIIKRSAMADPDKAAAEARRLAEQGSEPKADPKKEKAFISALERVDKVSLKEIEQLKKKNEELKKKLAKKGR